MAAPLRGSIELEVDAAMDTPPSRDFPAQLGDGQADRLRQGQPELGQPEPLGGASRS